MQYNFHLGVIRFSELLFCILYHRRPDQNDQSEDMPEEFRVRYTSPNFHSLNEGNEETESTPMLTRMRESSVAQNEQKTNQYGHSTSV